ncbi:DNA-directed RNA polymerase, partial [Candidatus Woesearchaeota archaeon]|nr:DNA-directed RNA polymerase [Candidatus Woesearchaeota archaeon]
GFISKDLGIVVGVSKVSSIQDGIIIPGDGASYYATEFELLTFKPELQEIVLGRIKDIADFGAFINLGPIDGMIHVSQAMDDFVSFSKDKVLLGKETKRSIKVNDLCRARIIATSFKDLTNPKLGLTMRQKGLGKLEWMEEELKQKEAKGK